MGTIIRSNEKTVASWPMGTWEGSSYLNYDKITNK